MTKEIAKIDKNSQEEIIVQLTEFKGHDLVDLRVWTKPLAGEADAKETPTRKGLTVKPDLIPELIEALQEAARTYRASQPGKA